jgi:hypothetical protein
MQRITFLLLLLCVALVASPVWGQSKDVVIIGGSTLDSGVGCGSVVAPSDANVMNATYGGCLNLSNVSGLTGFEKFNFTPMMPANVSAANLTAYDTAVLNIASAAMACNTNNLSAQAQADLKAFVESGKKLIIFDSECYPGPVNYSWLPYPFTTANPGAMGAHGTLTIVEENTLSSKISSNPLYIDAAHLSTATDAIGDMNVMTTYDPNWCLDMSGTNVLSITGPVHTYAKYPSDADAGLIIYNGLDQDYQYGYLPPDYYLTKIWLQELQQQFNPSNLPCGYTVVGITLTPETASNVAGTSHTVTATLSDLLGNPKPGILVWVEFTSGPNMSATLTCTPNVNCTTDATGVINFTYTGALAVGTDKLKACFTDTASHKQCSQEVTKTWTDGTPPEISCGSGGTLWPPNHKLVAINTGITASDPESGIASVILMSVSSNEPDNGLGDGDTANDIQGFQIGTNDLEGFLRAERSGKGTGRIYTFVYQATNGANLSSTCTATYVVPHDQR